MKRANAGRALALSGAVAALVACGEPGSLRPRGWVASEMGWMTLVLTVAGGLVFALVLVVLAVAVRRGRTDGGVPNERRSRRLILGGGVVLPVVVLVPLTIVMLISGIRIAQEPQADLDIEIVGHQFWWEVHYPDHGVVTANEIHIPVGADVRLRLESADVIHSVWAPRLAGKIDLIPGKTNELFIDADTAGVYQGYCAEFCGIQHARMRFLVVAQPPDEFDAWLSGQASEAAEPEGEAARRGLDLFAVYGCGECHRVAGTPAGGQAGPDLTHLASRRTLGAGTADNDRGNLAGWVVDPQGLKPGNRMPPTPISGEDLSDLLAYLEGLE